MSTQGKVQEWFQPQADAPVAQNWQKVFLRFIFSTQGKVQEWFQPQADAPVAQNWQSLIVSLFFNPRKGAGVVELARLESV